MKKTKVSIKVGGSSGKTNVGSTVIRANASFSSPNKITIKRTSNANRS